jgi:hypothetical protein
MNYGTILFCSLLSTLATAVAQEPSGRIDLGLLAGDPAAHLAVGSIAFMATAATCPQDLGTLRFHSDGTIEQLTASGFSPSLQTGRSSTTVRDDETHRYRVETDTCRVALDIGEQVHRDGAWTSVLLPRALRPSLSAGERSEAERQARNSYRDPVPLAQYGRYVDARNEGGNDGSLRQEVFATIRGGFGFDGAQACFDAIGNYVIDQRRVMFQFVTNLPGELNRFVLERVDIDDDHSRLYLTQGDCRFALTVSASVLAGDQWISRSIAPFIRPTFFIHCPACRDRDRDRFDHPE